MGVPQGEVPERARGLEEEEVVALAVVGDPRVPHPLVLEAQHGPSVALAGTGMRARRTRCGRVG
jgi:hypothetical protein